MTKHVAFSRPGDEVGEPSVEFHLYDYCDSHSVTSEAVSIDLSMMQDQQQQKRSMRGKQAGKSRGHDAGMGKLLKRGSTSGTSEKRASITSEVSHDISAAENSFWDNEENSFADYANLGNQKGGQRNSGKLVQRASITSEMSGVDSFWKEENSFADYAKFGGLKQDRRVSGSFHLAEEGFNDIRFDDEASLADSVLSMGSFALDGGIEIYGFEDIKDGEEYHGNHNNTYTAPSKASMLDGSMDSWSINESVLKEGHIDGEEGLKDAMPMRRADRRAQRARDRLSAYSRVPSRNGSIGSLTSNPRRNGSIGKYSDHSGPIPRRNGSIGKYSDHSGPRRTGSLGKYSDHSLGSLSMASSGPRRTGSLGKYSDHTPRGVGRRSSAAPGHRRNGSNGSLAAAVLPGRNRPTADAPEPDIEDGSPTVRQRNGREPGTGTEEGSPTVRQRNGRNKSDKKEVSATSAPSMPSVEKKDSIVSSKVTKAMKMKLGTDLPGGAILSPRTKSSKKSAKIKMGSDSDILPRSRSGSTRQQLLG
ncbi:unnamed protein product [Cylindrotheca closterium]|uniref:Uncharacterized protein n=1 Tax=Cylindrotheca closterium TaxID=2856 RepID=A0AAD2CHW5_9STRA|nr:unnamed protein product [Cylindrotheca closterium]